MMLRTCLLWLFFVIAQKVSGLGAFQWSRSVSTSPPLNIKGPKPLSVLVKKYPVNFLNAASKEKTLVQHNAGRMGRWEGRKLEVPQNSRITPRGVGFFFGLDSEKKGAKKPHPPGVYSEKPLYLLKKYISKSKAV